MHEIACKRILHFLVLLSALVWSTGKCEPPVNSYLPPSNGASGSRPQAEYGPPGVSQGGSHSRNNGHSGENNNRPQGTYGAPNGPGSSTSGSGFGAQSGPQAIGRNQAGNDSPSSQYGTPNSFGQSRNQPSSFGNNQGAQGTGRPQSTYGPPNGNQRHGNSGFGPQSGRGRGNVQSPDTSYGPPEFNQNSNGQSPRLGSPTQQGFQSPSDTSSSVSTNGNTFGENYDRSPETETSGNPKEGRPSDSYGAPISNGNDGDGENEPAQYQFNYDVDDVQTGTKFGHSEERNGDFTSGEYNVLLPDGRKQIVEYEADRQGYKPQIRYEGGGSGFGQGNTNGFNTDTQGYPSGPTGGGVDHYSNDEHNLGPQQPGGHQQSGGGPDRFSSDSPSFGSSQYKDDTGYPGNKPGNNFSGNGSNSPSGSSGGYPRDGPGQGFNSFSNNGGSGQSSQGYPSGRPNNGNGGGNFNGNGNGFQRNSNNAGERDSSGTNGYPRGGPEGARGSGY
ncbi:Pro-resilin [Eumeta japonica]|uniref:Pro-resilin n=1 Tax=Eumeta variegata TaxID=151549 RepID=A0A4C1VKP3_EUMVA|nr:Pro-resilin [Eumeta japonica]